MSERKVATQEDKRAAVELIVSEVRLFQEGVVSRLSTNGEWATMLGLTHSIIKRALRGALSEEKLSPTLSYRQTQIHRQIGAGLGTISYLEGLGAFGMTQEQLSERSSRTGTKLAAEGKGMFAMTEQQKAAVGRRSGRSAAEKSLGCHGVDPVTGESYAVLGARKTLQLGIGVHARSSEQKSLDGVKGSEVVDHRKVFFRDNHYDSYYEAAIAALMEKYIPGFSIQRGETYQITNGIHKKIDFYVNGIFVEFQPILLAKTKGSLGAFETDEEFSRYRQTLKGLSREERKQYKAQIKQQLKARYYVRRRAALNENPDFRDKELVVVINEQEFFELIVRRFSENIPESSSFVREFTLVTKLIAEENKKQRAALSTAQI